MHDVVVVGGGGAGVPLAVRLARSGASVLLLESGTAQPEPVSTLLVPGAQEARADLICRPVHLTATRRWDVGWGTGLGGSTAVNGGYFVRARRHDFEGWARLGGEHWSPQAVLPLLKRLEDDLDFPEHPEHGDGGPVPVERTPEHPLTLQLTRRALAAGVPLEPDKNVWATPGVGPVPMNARAGRRISTAVAYLAQGCPERLEIRTGVHATGVKIVNGRAVGVHTTQGLVPAGEVVLSAGALGSAHLLLLSGVGPARRLHDLGLPVVGDLPVGVGLSDHPQVVVEAPAAEPSREPLPAPAAWLGAAVHLTPPGASVPGTVEVLQSLLPIESLVAGSTGPARSALMVSDLTPVRRGSARLASTDPRVPLEVSLGYLTTAEDRARLRYGVRAAAGWVGHEAARLDDTPLDQWIAERLGTSVHTCGTAPMGSVVDGAGRVLGVEALRVGDTSILPTAPTRGPANTAVLIGELLGDLMSQCPGLAC